jgi:hypothetical protein
MKRMIKLNVVIMEEYHNYQQIKNLSNICPSRLIPHVDKITGIMAMGFNVTDQLLITFSGLIRYWGGNGSAIGKYCMISVLNLVHCPEGSMFSGTFVPTYMTTTDALLGYTCIL